MRLLGGIAWSGVVLGLVMGSLGSARATAFRGLEGSWVWERVERGGRTVLRIDPRSLVARTSLRGSPTCPKGVLCTAHGILALHVATDGSAHAVWNAITSSDFERVGRLSLEGNRGSFEVRRAFSCAHPDVRDGGPRTLAFDFRRDGNRLRLKLRPTDEAGFPLAPATDDTWVVFRRVSAERFDQTVIRVCQATDGHPCDPGCALPIARPGSPQR